MADKTKYLWYSEQLATISNDFNTEEECREDATKQIEDCIECAKDLGVEPSRLEIGIYAYDSEEFPDGDVDIEDCSYLGYLSNDK